MKPETKEWVSKAEGGFYDVLRGIRELAKRVLEAC
jgi:hypothetical protein